MDKSSLGDRIKRYENNYNFKLTNRLPVIIRIDGKKFSKWTKVCKFDKPFDSNLAKAMAETTLITADKIEGCMFGFTQSDEASFVIKNDQSLESTPWVSNRIQKIVSLISSIYTANFNNTIGEDYPLAYFDARVFVVPSVIEMHNYFCWRQNDATKNSISASCYYEIAKITGKKTARKMMHGLNQNQQQELLFQKANINWNDYPTKFKRGVGCYKIKKEFSVDDKTFTRTKWIIDEELPIISKEQSFLLNIFNQEG